MKLYNLIGFNKTTGNFTNPNNSTVENLTQNAFVWSATTPEGYELALLNGSEIEAIYAYHKYADKTFFNSKNIIEELMLTALDGNPANWTVTLNANERAICAKLGLVAKATRRTIYTQEEDVANMLDTLRKCQADRQQIWNAISDYLKELAIEETITQENIQDAQRDILVLVECWIRSNAPYLSQWFQNTIGSDYFLLGFAQKGYYSSTIRDGVMDIYNNY